MKIRTPVHLLSIWILALFLSGCSETDMKDLTFRHGKAYQKNSGTPFSGSVVSYFPQRRKNEKPKVYQSGSYNMGLKDGRWITYNWNGEKEDMPYVNGRRQGMAKWYYTHDRLKREQRYSMNVKHGEGAYYDTSGRTLKKVYYDRDRMIPPPPDREKGIKDLTKTGLKDERGFFEKLLSGVADFIR